MPLTIIEAAKLDPGDVVRSAIVEMYTRNNDILRVLPFESITSTAFTYHREDILPGLGLYRINGSFSEWVALKPVIEFLTRTDIDLDVDCFIITMMHSNQQTDHEGLKVRVIAYRWTLAFLKADY